MSAPNENDDEVQDAILATHACLADEPGRSVADPTLPIYRYAARLRLEELQRSFRNGDQHALLAAIRICANHDLVLPDWCSHAYIIAYDKVLRCQSDSWDEVFGRPYKKGAHLSRLRQAREKRIAVWVRVSEAVRRNVSINRELFEEIGRELGIGRTRTEELYAQGKVAYGRPAKN